MFISYTHELYQEGHICRPPPGKEVFFFLLGHFYFAIMITLLTTPGIRLMGAARLDEMQRVGERGGMKGTGRKKRV